MPHHERLNPPYDPKTFGPNSELSTTVGQIENTDTENITELKESFQAWIGALVNTEVSIINGGPDEKRWRLIASIATHLDFLRALLVLIELIEQSSDKKVQAVYRDKFDEKLVLYVGKMSHALRGSDQVVGVDSDETNT